MSRFKVGDKVTPVNVYRDNDIMGHLVGKTLLVRSVGNDKNGDATVCAGVPGEEDWYWHSDDLRLVSETQAEPTDPAPAASKKPKPIRRGDLVMHRGQIGVVHEIDPDGEDGYWVAMLTGDARCVCRGAEDLTCVGSIRKKVERLKQERKA